MQSDDKNNSKYVISKYASLFYLFTLTSPPPSFYLQTNTTLLSPAQHSHYLFGFYDKSVVEKF